ncbi:hypothetical protein PPYR_12562 [Photinus pyralis]|uniref:Tc1-like transposase DDE domain-containing protein n=1 Tax=Photinus pyralis TaxID=7054 RepID=A0A5N4A6J3_PHOPY|nr:hypothetical protein PPYR_12562 [Photinus pyralis]
MAFSRGDVKSVFVETSYLESRCLRDYHDNMNRGNFENWFKTQLVPNLPDEKSLIIMDNASYHSGLLEKIPTKSWTKQRMIEWLGENNIGYPEKAMKDQIWSICKSLEKPYGFSMLIKRLVELRTGHSNSIRSTAGGIPMHDPDNCISKDFLYPPIMHLI